MIRVGKRKPPRRSSALPPRRLSAEAAPKYISGRTSYLRVRLAFHPYPQVIPPVCNLNGFGPPRACYARFTLPMGSSPGFGSTPRDLSPFRTRFRSGSGCRCLNLATEDHSSAHSTKSTPSPGSRQAPTGWKRTVSGSLSLPSPGCFSPFPHGTGSLSVARRYLALGGGRPASHRIPRVRRYSRCITAAAPPVAYGALTPPAARSRAVRLDGWL